MVLATSRKPLNVCRKFKEKVISPRKGKEIVEGLGDEMRLEEMTLFAGEQI